MYIETIVNIGPTMWNELKEYTSVDVFKKRKLIFSFFTINSYSFFLSHNFLSSYFVIVDMYIFIIIVFM